MKHPRAFISYSHESEKHRETVLQFAWALQRGGIQVALDRFHTRPVEGWPTWCERQLKPEMNDWVLMVSTKTYWDRVNDEVPADEGCGVFWEGRIIKNRVYRGKSNEDRFVAVSFDESGIQCLPPYVDRDSSYLLGSFQLEEDQGYENLYRLITNQRAVEEHPIGPIQELPVRRAGSAIKRIEEVGKGEVKWKNPDEVAGLGPASPRKGIKESSMENNHDTVNAGTIMVADVADFSDSYDDEARAKIYAAVWGYVRTHEMLKGGSTKGVFCDNTLDGAVVCFRPPLYKEALEFACKWVRHVSDELERSNVKVQLRVGIGRGNFLLESRAGEAGEPATAPADAELAASSFNTDLIPFGQGVNEVNRLARIAGVDKVGGKGFVVVDEAFLRDFEGRYFKPFRALIEPAIFPNLVQDPCAKLSKAGHVQKFRVLNVYDASPLVPTGVAEIAQLSKLILTLMGNMVARLWEYLYPDYMAHMEGKESSLLLSQEKLRSQSKLRVSLFCQDPREAKGKLLCTNFRLLDWEGTPEEAALAQPFTGYPLSEDGERGPAGTAFADNRCIFINDLPVVKIKDGKPTSGSLAGYLDALDECNCGVSREVAKNMKRYARTYMCLPMGLVPNHPTMVVCMDLAGEFSWMAQEDGLALASLLQEEYGGLLSLLVDKRT